MASAPTDSRYATLLKLASGGMATVWIGTARGGMGFRQLVAIKKPHPHLLDRAEIRAALLAEAALASSIRHVNVVDVRDVEVCDGAISLVMDYIEGASLSELLTSSLNGGPRITPAVAVRIALDALAGLHAAHELVDDRGKVVGLVHRDVSPQNILVGLDGVARVVDFGVAKFEKKGDATMGGQLKGKLAYMAPEYLRSEPFDRRVDVFAVGVVLWETLAAQRLFRGNHDADTVQKVLGAAAPAVSRFTPEAAPLEPVLARALSKNPAERYPTAAAMALELETLAAAAGLVATPRDVSELVKASVGDALEERRKKLREKSVDVPSVASLFEGVRAAEIAPPTVAEVVPHTQPLDARTLPLAGRGALAVGHTLPLEPTTAPLGGALGQAAPAEARTLPLEPGVPCAPAYAAPHSSDAGPPNLATMVSHPSGSSLPSTPTHPSRPSLPSVHDHGIVPGAARSVPIERVAGIVLAAGLAFSGLSLAIVAAVALGGSGRAADATPSTPAASIPREPAPPAVAPSLAPSMVASATAAPRPASMPAASAKAPARSAAPPPAPPPPRPAAPSATASTPAPIVRPGTPPPNPYAPQ